MEVDLPAVSVDVDMSAQMKRNLSAEFDRQSLSRERRSSQSAVVTPKPHKSAVKRRRSSTQVSGQRRTRRSVRFIDASDSPTCERLPVTPFNKDSRGVLVLEVIHCLRESFQAQAVWIYLNMSGMNERLFRTLNDHFTVIVFLVNNLRCCYLFS